MNKFLVKNKNSLSQTKRNNNLSKILSCAILFSLSVDTNIRSSDVEKNYTKINNAFVTDFDLATQLSKETGLKIVVVFSAEWCEYCQKFKNDLPEIKNFDNKIICIVETENNQKLVRKFKIKNLPTSLILNTESVEIDRIVGYNKSSYENWLGSGK
jgi:thioredoxin-related protein